MLIFLSISAWRCVAYKSVDIKKKHVKKLKRMSKEEDNDVFVVSSDNESQTIIKKKKLGGLQEFSFIALCRVSYFNLVSVRFGTILL